MTPKKQAAAVCASAEQAGPKTKIGKRNLKIREARTHLPEVVKTVGASSVFYTVGQRGDNTAMIVSSQRVQPLFERRIEPKLALVVVEQLLPDAPMHLKAPAIAELSQLCSSDLLQLLTIDALPISKKRLGEMRKQLAQPVVFDRLLRRFELAQAIQCATDEGLYDVTEHKTSNAS